MKEIEACLIPNPIKEGQVEGGTSYINRVFYIIGGYSLITHLFIIH